MGNGELPNKAREFGAGEKKRLSIVEPLIVSISLFIFSLYLMFLMKWGAAISWFGAVISCLLVSAFFVLKTLYDASKKARVFWEKLSYWQKASIFGFAYVGIFHVLIVMLDIIVEGGRAFHTLAVIVLEYPLLVFHDFLSLLFKTDFFPTSDSIIFWIWIYMGGTIAWGIVGAVPGLLLGVYAFLSKLRAKKKGRPLARSVKLIFIFLFSFSVFMMQYQSGLGIVIMVFGMYMLFEAMYGFTKKLFPSGKA